MSGGTHDKHRERLDRKVIRDGIEFLEPHEQLEFILFAVIPRGNVNEVAHKLLERFGSLSGVFNADIEQLTEFDGIGARAAKFLKTLPSLLGITERNLKYNQPPRLFAHEEITDYASTFFYGKMLEEAYLFSLNSSFRLRCVSRISKGGETHTYIHPKQVVKQAIYDNAAVALVVHNHPCGSAAPSFEDISLSRQLNDALAAVDIKFLDSVIISGQRSYSIRANGYLDKIKDGKDFESEYKIQLI